MNESDWRARRHAADATAGAASGTSAWRWRRWRVTNRIEDYFEGERPEEEPALHFKYERGGDGGTDWGCVIVIVAAIAGMVSCEALRYWRQS